MISTNEYLHQVLTFFQEAGDPETAEGQMNYMRNKFEYHGVKAKGWIDFSKKIFKTEGVCHGKALKEFVRLCFAEEHREVHYFGLQMVERVSKKQEENFIDFLEELIVTHSWWDTVDYIAANLVGRELKNPASRDSVLNRWLKSEDLWLQRTTLIYQLKYRDTFASV